MLKAVVWERQAEEWNNPEMPQLLKDRKIIFNKAVSGGFSLEANQCLSRSSGVGMLRAVVFAKFCGVNTPTRANFQVTIWRCWMLHCAERHAKTGITAAQGSWTEIWNYKPSKNESAGTPEAIWAVCCHELSGAVKGNSISFLHCAASWKGKKRVVKKNCEFENFPIYSLMHN